MPSPTCLYCGKTIPLLGRLSGNDFCSVEHRRRFRDARDELALKVLAENERRARERDIERRLPAGAGFLLGESSEPAGGIAGPLKLECKEVGFPGRSPGEMLGPGVGGLALGSAGLQPLEQRPAPAQSGKPGRFIFPLRVALAPLLARAELFTRQRVPTPAPLAAPEVLRAAAPAVCFPAVRPLWGVRAPAWPRLTPGTTSGRLAPAGLIAAHSAGQECPPLRTLPGLHWLATGPGRPGLANLSTPTAWAAGGQWPLAAGVATPVGTKISPPPRPSARIAPGQVRIGPVRPRHPGLLPAVMPSRSKRLIDHLRAKGLPRVACGGLTEGVWPPPLRRPDYAVRQAEAVLPCDLPHPSFDREPEPPSAPEFAPAQPLGQVPELCKPVLSCPVQAGVAAAEPAVIADVAADPGPAGGALGTAGAPFDSPLVMRRPASPPRGAKTFRAAGLARAAQPPPAPAPAISAAGVPFAAPAFSPETVLPGSASPCPRQLTWGAPKPSRLPVPVAAGATTARGYSLDVFVPLAGVVGRPGSGLAPDGFPEPGAAGEYGVHFEPPPMCGPVEVPVARLRSGHERRWPLMDAPGNSLRTIYVPRFYERRLGAV